MIFQNLPGNCHIIPTWTLKMKYSMSLYLNFSLEYSWKCLIAWYKIACIKTLIFKFLAWNSTILKNSVEGPVCFFPTSVSLLSCASTWSMSCHFSLALLQLGLSHWVHKFFELAFPSSMRIQMCLNNVFSPIVACFVRQGLLN